MSVRHREFWGSFLEDFLVNYMSPGDFRASPGDQKISVFSGSLPEIPGDSRRYRETWNVCICTDPNVNIVNHPTRYRFINDGQKCNVRRQYEL